MMRLKVKLFIKLYEYAHEEMKLKVHFLSVFLPFLTVVTMYVVTHTHIHTGYKILLIHLLSMQQGSYFL